MSHFKGAAADEIFVGNCERDSNRVASLQAKGCRTARIGDVAYCIEGKPLPHTWAPLFIGRSEEAVYDDIMMTATFGPNWRRH